MSNQVFEEVNRPRAGHAAGSTAIEQQASQLLSDIKYKTRKEMKEKSGSNLSPAQVKELYRKYFNASNAPGPVKAIVSKRLFEQYDFVDAHKMAEQSISRAYTQVFVNGFKKNKEVVEVDEEVNEREYKIRVKDKETSNTYVTTATRSEMSKLRKNPNIASVEMTGYGEPIKNKPKKKAKKAKKDHDGDGKVESGSKEHAGVVHNAIQRNTGGVADGQDTRKEGYVDEAFPNVKGTRNPWEDPKTGKSGIKMISDPKTDKPKEKTASALRGEEYIREVNVDDESEKKLDVMKGKNKVKINPKLGEQVDLPLSPQEVQLLKQKTQISQRLAAAERKRVQQQQQQQQTEEMHGVRYCPKCDKDETREECKYGGEYWDENSKPARAVDPRAVSTMVNLVKNRMRARGLNMSYEPELNQVEANDPFADKPYDEFGRPKNPKARRKAREKASTLRNQDRQSGRRTYGTRLGYADKEWDEPEKDK